MTSASSLDVPVRRRGFSLAFAVPAGEHPRMGSNGGSKGPKPPLTGESWASADEFLRALAHAPARQPEGPDPTRLAQFHVRKRLGKGGMGVVYLAMDERLQREVALKVLPTEFEANPERRRRFLREARTAASVTHPNIATIYEISEAEGRVFIAMERVAGETLRARLARGRMPLDQVVAVARQLLDALSRAHEKGVVHCDLKPENVMFDERGAVKILDFGLAKLRAAELEVQDQPLAFAETTLSPSNDARVVGTPGYMAPEQARGEALDQRVDVFAFGVMLYEMVAGVRPFTAGTSFQVLVAVERDAPPALKDYDVFVSPKLEAVIERCLAKKREDRFPSARSVLESLEEAGPHVTRSEGPKGGWRPWSIGVGALAAVLFLGAWALLPRLAAPLPSQTAAPTASSTPPAPLRLGDAPPPKTKSAQAAAEYGRALTDLRDAVRPPQVSLERAVELDPEFAAAHLRLAIVKTPPASTRAYGEALRFQSTLDARDLDLLHAEEPLAVQVPPDPVEAERRYAALAERNPRDVEILLRLAGIRSRLDPVSARPTFALLLELDTKMAGEDLAAGDNEGEADDQAGAIQHYERCLTLSPAGVRCLTRLARLRASDGVCERYASDIKRALFLQPDDWPLRRQGVAAALTAESGDDAVQAAITGVVRVAPSDRGRFDQAELEGQTLLWRGAMRDARDAFLRAEPLARKEAKGLPVTVLERLTIAEELGDEDDVRAITRQYLGARALNTPDRTLDGVVLGAMRRHRLMPDSEIQQLRDRWQGDRGGAPDAQGWLEYQASLAGTPEEALQALASGNDKKLSHARLDVNARVGHLLFVGGRSSEAAERLSLVANNCALFRDEMSFVPFIVPAAYELGLAREALQDEGGACDAYRRVLQVWGGAVPRSKTALAARARMAALHCTP